MCRLSTIWGTIFAMLLLVCGCTAEPFDEYGVGDEVLVSFQPSLDLDITTRAISDGQSISELIVVVYDGEDDHEVLRKTYTWEEAAQDGVSLSLVKGYTYNILFWAQHKDVYTISDKGEVSIDYTSYLNGGFAQMENLDAFHSLRNITINGNGQEEIELTRLLGQINFGSEVQPDATFPCVVTFTGMVTGYNFLTGEATRATEPQVFTYTDFPTTEQLTTADGKTYYYVASAYLFPATVDVAYQLGEVTHDFKNVAVGANKRINVLGDIVTQPVTMDKWDGKTITTPTANAEGNYEIATCAELLGLDQITPPSGKVFITNDLDFDNHPAPSLHNLNGVTIDGGEEGHTLMNLNLGNALFGDATNLTVKNLTIDGVTISSANNATPTHVGTLVNTLMDGGAFSNVTVKNANVATNNGAAGGMVGYIKRANDTDAGFEVTFDNCHVAGNTVNGTLSEGHFVGLLRGYDNNEVLTFNSNCTKDQVESEASERSVADYASPYVEGNEACWVASTDFTNYNGWLGTQEFFRAPVYYGGKSDANRFVLKWDGVTKVEPVKINNNEYAIYSAFDLAYLQGKTPTRVNFKENVDLNGDRNSKTNPFTPIGSIKYLDGEEHTLYNLYVEVDDMGGFIASAAGESTHENLTFENSAVVVHFVVLGSEDRGYAGTLTPVVWSGTNYVVSNINVNNSYVFGLGKIGGLIGFIDGGTTGSTIKDCTVTGTTVKNEKGKTQELFEKSVAGATVSTRFYAHGEAGGLIGMLMGNSDIDNCHVTNSTMDCYGEQNYTQKVFYFFTVTVQGRHVNNFIGDIRTAGYWIGDKQYTNVVTIDGCSATNNTYITADGKRKDEFSRKASLGVTAVSTNLVGEPYYLNVYKIVQVDPKGSVKIDGVEFL